LCGSGFPAAIDKSPLSESRLESRFHNQQSFDLPENFPFFTGQKNS